MVETVSAIGRRWRIFAPFAIVTPLVVLALSASTPKFYESSAGVLLNRQGFVLSDLRDVTFWYPNRAQLTEAQLARLPEVAQRVVDAAELSDRGRFGFLAQSWLEAGQFTDMMTFHVRDGDPRLASRLATTYAEQYIAFRRALDTQSLRRAIRVVDSSLAALRAENQDLVLYADFVRKRQQLDTALASVETNATLVSPAALAVASGSNSFDSALRGLILGLVVGVGLAALAHLVDPRARTAVEIAEGLGVPLLARLPADRRIGPTRRAPFPTALADRRAEAVRRLRTELGLTQLADGSLVLVTSGTAGEGKTTTAADLSLSLAATGRTVVLVDLDLRQPMLTHRLGLRSAPGISDVVRGVATLNDALREIPLELGDSDTEGSGPSQERGLLRALGAGTTAGAEPWQVSADPMLPPTFEELRGTADIVLVDSPPLLQASEAITLATHVDAVLLVASMLRYRPAHARETMRLLALADAEVLGVAVVGASADEVGLPRVARVNRRFAVGVRTSTGRA